MNLTARIKNSARNILVGASLAGLVSSCQPSTPESVVYTTIKGEPLSAETGSSHGNTYLAGALRMSDNKVVLFYADGGRTMIDLAALINSEINDDDNEPVELYGIACKDDSFLVWTIMANGIFLTGKEDLNDYEINFCLYQK